MPDAAAVSAVLRELLATARAAGAPVAHVRNNGDGDDPDKPGTPGWELVTCDTFASADLATLLPPSAPLVIAGMQSDYCVRETTLAALERGHPVTPVRGGHATYHGTVYHGTVPAAEASARVEDELVAAGAAVVDREAVTFG